MAIPKTATHSIRNALRPHLAENDWEQCRLFEKKSFPVKALASIRSGHISCRQVKPFLLDQWESFFRFSVVRNPYKRFFSYCYFINRKNSRMESNPLETMKKTINNKKIHKRLLFRPQYKFITDKSDKLMVNYVCRLENLQNDFGEVCQKLNLPNTDLQKINTSDSSKSPFIFDEELREMVYDFYQKDFEIFGYSETL